MIVEIVSLPWTPVCYCQNFPNALFQFEYYLNDSRLLGTQIIRVNGWEKIVVIILFVVLQQANEKRAAILINRHYLSNYKCEVSSVLCFEMTLLIHIGDRLT